MRSSSSRDGPPSYRAYAAASAFGQELDRHPTAHKQLAPAVPEGLVDWCSHRGSMRQPVRWAGQMPSDLGVADDLDHRLAGIPFPGDT